MLRRFSVACVPSRRLRSIGLAAQESRNFEEILLALARFGPFRRIHPRAAGVGAPPPVSPAAPAAPPAPPRPPPAGADLSPCAAEPLGAGASGAGRAAASGRAGAAGS